MKIIILLISAAFFSTPASGVEIPDVRISGGSNIQRYNEEREQEYKKQQQVETYRRMEYERRQHEEFERASHRRGPFNEDGGCGRLSGC